MTTTRRKILVLCTGNSCRSQMAEGYLRYFAGNRADIYSAGTAPHGVHPRAVTVMSEDGLDISGHTSDHVDACIGIDFDFVLTVCDHAREQCPVFPTNAVRIHHSFSDPAHAHGSDQEIAEQFRLVRDQIKEYCRQFSEKHL